MKAERGYTVKQIAKKSNVLEETIRVRLKKLNLEAAYKQSGVAFYSRKSFNLVSNKNYVKNDSTIIYTPVYITQTFYRI